MFNQPTFISTYSSGQAFVKFGTTLPLTVADSLISIYKSPTSSMGSLVQYCNIQSLGTNAACILRLFLNNGNDKNVLANNSLIKEISLPATTGSNIESIASSIVELSLKIPAGYELFATLSLELDNGYSIVAFGGDF